MTASKQMPEGLQLHLQMEIMCSHIKLKANKPEDAWYHLDRAHLLSRRYPKAHYLVHFEMIKFGYKSQHYTLFVSQIFKFCLAGISSSMISKKKSGTLVNQHIHPKVQDIQRILGYYL